MNESRRPSLQRRRLCVMWNRNCLSKCCADAKTGLAKARPSIGALVWSARVSNSYLSNETYYESLILSRFAR